jgi:hypothetical protein
MIAANDADDGASAVGFPCPHQLGLRMRVESLVRGFAPRAFSRMRSSATLSREG